MSTLEKNSSTPWNHFEQALLMSLYPLIYHLNQDKRLKLIWVSARMNIAINRRGITHGRELNSIVIRQYLTENRDGLVRQWGEDGATANRYIEAADTVLETMRGNIYKMLHPEAASNGRLIPQEELVEQINSKDMVDSLPYDISPMTYIGTINGKEQRISGTIEVIPSNPTQSFHIPTPKQEVHSQISKLDHSFHAKPENLTLSTRDVSETRDISGPPLCLDKWGFANVARILQGVAYLRYHGGGC
ncbi:hypothetical protein HYALB_00012804 [Hymenoscyphus albidus]|uniref:Uncharacterized protein n=1 Tax=Hymenoscyphus albidus TaxID=595503 RepID=A0A9N9LTZ7_9HELO|nr:hypothetical protein HYALB_00012804 [Hymenoscyphus albidus]